jgi:hypothetical protein
LPAYAFDDEIGTRGLQLRDAAERSGADASTRGEVG